jgi:Domain of unknown function (DUF389)
MGWPAKVIDAGREYRDPLAEVEDGLLLDIGSRRAKSTRFWVQLVLASIIAAGGVIGDCTRTAPMILALPVAVVVGVAGSFALSPRDVADILAGVAIAISLVPVLAVVGITLGEGRLDLALGAFVLFLTNAAAILVAGALVFTAVGYKREAAHRDARAGERARRSHRRGRADAGAVGRRPRRSDTRQSSDRAADASGATPAAR